MSRRAPPPSAGDDLEVIEVDGAGEPVGRATHPLLEDDHDEPDEPGGRRSRRRRVVWLVVGVVAALIAATVALTTRHDHTTPKSVTLRTASGVKGAPSVSPPRFAIGATVRALHAPPFVLAGDAGAYSVDSRRAQVAPVAGLSGNAATVVDRNGNTVFVEDGDQRVLVDLTNRRPLLTLGDATAFPATEPDHFWITQSRTVHDAYGGPGYTLPPGDQAIAEVDGASPTDVAFLLRVVGEDIVRWSPRHGMLANPLLHGDAHVVAVRHDRVAWTGADCGSLRCAVHVTDVATGNEALLGVPLPSAPDGEPVARAATGRFSPDGRFLAVLVPGIAAASVDVVVFDLTSGTATATFGLYDPTPDTPPIPFDWSRDSTSLIALEAGDSGRYDRLVVLDARTGIDHRSGDALPLAVSLVTLGLPPATAPSAPLPAPKPLLGVPTGIVLVNADDQGMLERLDLDTGRVNFYPLRAGGPATNFTPSPDTGNVITALDNGLIVIDISGAWWVPRAGPPHFLGHADSVLRENGQRAWLSRLAGGTNWLTPIDGNGTIGPQLQAPFEPWAATSRGFVELPPNATGPPSIVVRNLGTGARLTIAASGVLLHTGGDIVVWQSGECNRIGCPAHITDVATNSDRTILVYDARSLLLAPDGHAIVYAPLSGGGSGLTYLDLVTGYTAQLLNATSIGNMVWGPNGWLFYGTEDGLAAWRPAHGDPVPLPGVLGVPRRTAAL